MGWSKDPTASSDFAELAAMSSHDVRARLEEHELVSGDGTLEVFLSSMAISKAQSHLDRGELIESEDWYRIAIDAEDRLCERGFEPSCTQTMVRRSWMIRRFGPLSEDVARDPERIIAWFRSSVGMSAAEVASRAAEWATLDDQDEKLNEARLLVDVNRKIGVLRILAGLPDVRLERDLEPYLALDPKLHHAT